ncbi:hypothetical protein [Paractinoplanes lichenicola]|uniref:hypothetical protein n=1 Tax=Paractinoplanes lichenicola TaxID=2802976 RepID=UPI0034DB090F
MAIRDTAPLHPRTAAVAAVIAFAAAAFVTFDPLRAEPATGADGPGASVFVIEDTTPAWDCPWEPRA